jgi:hypothetical protein
VHDAEPTLHPGALEAAHDGKAGPVPSEHATEPPGHHGAKTIGSDDQARSQLPGGAVSQADPHSQGSAILGREKIEGSRGRQEVDTRP